MAKGSSNIPPPSKPPSNTPKTPKKDDTKSTSPKSEKDPKKEPKKETLTKEKVVKAESKKEALTKEKVVKAEPKQETLTKDKVAKIEAKKGTPSSKEKVAKTDPPQSKAKAAKTEPKKDPSSNKEKISKVTSKTSVKQLQFSKAVNEKKPEASKARPIAVSRFNQPPVKVSPVIKAGRWSLLLLGIFYGSSRRKFLSKREVGVREEEKKLKAIRDAKIIEEKAAADASELAMLAELFLGPQPKDE